MISKTSKIIKTKNKIKNGKFPQLIMKKESLTNKWRSKWPANKLAVIRTLKVIGRINNLVISIKTKKNLNIIGEVGGVKWIKNFLYLFQKELAIQENHIKNLKKNK